MFGPFHILALHGSQQTGEILRTRLDPLVQKFGKECTWSFPDGPVEHELLQGDSVPRRSWFKGSTPSWNSTLPVPVEIYSKAKVIIGFSQGGLLAIACALKSEICRLVITAGTPNADWIDSFIENTSTKRYLKMIFLAGETDEIVPSKSTKELCDKLKKRGIICEFRTFAGNHYFPVTSKHVEEYKRDVEGWQLVAGSEQSVQIQTEELEVLRSIYADGLEEDQPAPVGVNEPGFRVALTNFSGSEQQQGAAKATSRLVLAAPCDYPFESDACVWIEGTTYNTKKLQDVVKEAVSNLRGEMQMFACISAVQESLDLILNSNNNEQEQEDSSEDEPNKLEEEEDELDDASTHELIEQLTNEARHAVISASASSSSDFVTSDTRQGHWHQFCVGLLGKPSAGKSSFFNACTQNALLGKREAEEGAQPFTTIDPNLGVAMCKVTPTLSLQISVKDVAGLVPGAYKGLGKGNKFLNDLLDADALLHICDGTGSADDGGRIAFESAASPEKAVEQVTRDALWVLREVHLWIYGNITAKWPQHKKRGRMPGEANALRGTNLEKHSPANRVCQLFVGYHAPPSMTMRAAKLAGLDLDKAPDFTREMRHRLCAFFIAVRFPVVLVLNKSDYFFVSNNEEDDDKQKLVKSKLIQAVGESAKKIMGSENLVAFCSARIEKELLDLVAAKRIEYNNESGAISVLQEFELSRNSKVISVFQAMNNKTGVHEALVKAIRAARPLFVDAIVDKEKKGFAMYPGSTVYDLYETCVRNGIAAGDFVRAEEVVEGSSGGRTRSREALVREHRAVRIATNKKISHQQKSTTMS